jgi:hypothetical protein
MRFDSPGASTFIVIAVLPRLLDHRELDSKAYQQLIAKGRDPDRVPGHAAPDSVAAACASANFGTCTTGRPCRFVRGWDNFQKL